MNSHNTAISRVKPSKAAQLVLNTLKDRYNLESIFDFGCGRGKDCQCYADAGLLVEGYDKYYKPDFPPITNKYDFVTTTYVLNVIPDKLERVLALELAFYYVKPGGHLLVTTRTEHDIKRQATKNEWTSFGDGYCSSLSKQTFQKGFQYEELKDLLINSLPIADIELMANELDMLSILVQKKR